MRVSALTFLAVAGTALAQGPPAEHTTSAQTTYYTTRTVFSVVQTETATLSHSAWESSWATSATAAPYATGNATASAHGTASGTTGVKASSTSSVPTNGAGMVSVGAGALAGVVAMLGAALL